MADRSAAPGPLTGLPLRLLTMVALPLLIALLVLSFGSVALHEAAMRDLVAGHDVQAVRGVAASLSVRLEHQEAVLLALTAQAARSGDPAAVAAGADSLFDGGVAFYDARGNLLAASPRVATWQSSSPIRPDLAAALTQAAPGGDAVLLPLVEPGSASTRVAIVLQLPPLARQKVAAAIGVVSLDELGFPTLVDALNTSPGAAATLATLDGLILYHSDPARVGETLSAEPGLSAALRGEIGADYHRDSQGHPVIAAFAPVGASGWVLVQQERWTEMLRPLTRYSQAALLALVPGLAIGAAAVWFSVRRIVHPLQQLEARATGLAAGDFVSIEQPVGGIDEIQHLQGSLRKMAAQLRRAHEVMRYYIGSITRAQEDERLRLARDLHDHMIQSLIALDQRQQMLKRYLQDSPAGAAALAELRTMTAQTIDDLRRVIRAMRPIYLEDFGLVPALEVLARDISAEAGIPVDFNCRGEPRRLPPDREMALYRIAQESLNNARWHSRASRITLDVIFEPAHVSLTVRDDGVGFRAPRRVTDLSGSGHFGLIGMYERADLINAELDLQSAPGAGTVVALRAALPAESAAFTGTSAPV